MIIKVAWGKYIGLICILLLGMFSSPASAELVNIVSNSGFESGITQWGFYTNGGGTFLNDVSGPLSPSAGHITISLPGSNVQLYQTGITLEPNTRYQLSFAAYSTIGHDVTVRLFKHFSPYTVYMPEYTANLGMGWTTFSTEFTSSGFTGIVNDGRLMFWLAPYAASGDQYFFDNVTITKVSSVTPPTIITQPSNQNVGAGQTATFNVDATGTTPLSYQWQKNGVNINGATTASYITPPTALSDSGSTFRVNVTNSAGSVMSNAATLIVTQTTSINNIKNPGFESGTTSWGFYTNGQGAFDMAPGYEGNNAAKISINSIVLPPNIQLYQTGVTLEPNTRYRLSFAAYSSTGHDVTVRLFKHVSPYTVYMPDYTANLGMSWQTFITEFATPDFQGAANDGRLMFWFAPFAVAKDIYYIDNIRLEKIGSIPPGLPKITTHPASQTVIKGQTATFGVVATGTLLSYQWLKNGANIPGATGATYTTPSTVLADNGATFSVIVSNAAGSVTSSGATLTVISALSNKQLLLMDITNIHNASTIDVTLRRPSIDGVNVVESGKGFSQFNIPSWVPDNLVSPENYAQGTVYQRLQVITKPSTMTVQYQFCVFQDQFIPEKHACGNPLRFTGLGTYYASQPMTSLYQYNNLFWERYLLTFMIAIKDGDGYGNPVDDRWGFGGKWIGSPDFTYYYPMKVRYTVIIVAPGGGEPVWP